MFPVLNFGKFILGKQTPIACHKRASVNPNREDELCDVSIS